MTTVVIILRITAILIVLYTSFVIKKTFAVRPNRELLQHLKGTYLTRYASRSIVSDTGSVSIHPINNWETNISAGFRPVTWFFVGEPTTKNLAKNNVTSSEIRIRVPFDSLNPDLILYRQSDNVIGYLGVLEGSFEILDPDLVARSGLNRKKFYYKYINTIFIAVTLVFVCLALFGENIGSVILLSTIALMFVVAIIGKIQKRIARSRQ